MRPATRAADAAIRLYQARISPRKGWTCAHLVAHGGQSCSAAVRDVVLREGVVRAVVPAAVRFLACYRAAAVLASTDVEGVCCCGGIPIPFRFRRR
ncbi:membrane protein insertion efficiency factor YidD [Georgenia ruanii]|uniref:Membrane protein insertion efficiency factor YidD n=1 Tax=Georgenia ruanii TaxID=348442 RepID=A0A7J9UUX2_9MICO|nr:membrane protein insertion efficiency factor YidD [Georgenia ruanii]MPV88143.1 membrane protein insertion efficiency factor YidD [Georgenia ruanii]